MKKPIKDWTLGEVQAECKRRNAPCASSGCPFYGEQGLISCCKLRDHPPEAWDMTDTPTITQEERVIFRALRGLGCTSVSIKEDGSVECGGVFSRLLPSMRPGDELDLDTMDLEAE